MKFLLTVISMVVSLGVVAECLFVDDKSSADELFVLRELAYKVMDAEGGSCAHIKERSLRSTCQCEYRKEPLVQFIISYEAVLEKHPSYGNRMICYSENSQGISVNFSAYKQVSLWCR